MSITPLILTFNEAPNIRRTLSCLTWAQRVLVIDSGSTDETLGICREFRNVQVVHRAFDSFAAQCNFGLTQIHSEWCLSIDADYLIPAALSDEMQEVVRTGTADGYTARFVYCIQGHRLRGTLYPPRVVLFRTALGTYEQDGHSHRLALRGATHPLTHAILHDDRKPLRRWLQSQDTYATQEVAKLAGTHWSELSWPDRIRSLGFVAPWLAPVYYLFAKGGIRDGWAGMDYAAQRAIAELVLSIKWLETRRLSPRDEDEVEVPRATAATRARHDEPG